MDSRGHYFLLASFFGTEAPVVYAPDGKFLTSLGRIGDGPGEFRMATALLLGPGDSVYVLDNQARRMSVFSSALKFARAVPLPHRLEMGGKVAALLGDGRFATNMDVRSRRDSSGPSLQILNPNGTIANQFGNDSIPTLGGVNQGRSMRTLAASRDGLWSGTLLFEYRLELWDNGGQRKQRLRRAPPWFESYDTLMSRSPEHPPQPALVRIREDGDGRLWAVSLVSDSQWAEGLSQNPVRGEGGALYYRTEDPEAALDSYLEIIDPHSGRLLISRRFDGLYTYLINDTLIGRQVWDENGIPSVEVYRVSLRLTEVP